MRRLIGCVILVVVAGSSAVCFGQPQAQRAPYWWFDRGYSQFIFYAVMEGLYEDGVSSAVVDAIIPPAANGNAPDFSHSFVYRCPLCHPAYEAMRLYRSRQPFIGQKTPDPATKRSTFGAGLADSMQKKLLSDDEPTRRAALQELIRAWVERRVERLRLTDEERAALARGMEEGRAEGMKALDTQKMFAREKGLPAPELNWMNCAVCDGSFGACQTRPSPIRISPVPGPVPGRP